MKFVLLITAVFITQAALVNCGDNNDGGMSNDDCAAAYMVLQMMNSGPQVMGPSPWLLACLGISTFLFTTGNRSSVYRRVANK